MKPLFRSMILFLIATQILFATDRSKLKKIQVNLEIVTDNAIAGGDGSNQWGGHQCRIVETADGIYTAYTSGGKDHFNRRWHLMVRSENQWQELATGKSGREPVNLMAGPDGTLYLIGYPAYKGTIWSGKPQNGQIELSKEKIPAVYTGSHPYNSAGIDSDGNICVLSSVEYYNNLARFQWAYYDAANKKWHGRFSFLDYRHCYTYIFPKPDRSIFLVSTRDVRWETLGYTQPPDVFRYVFNAFRFWSVEDINQPLKELVFVEEPPTPDHMYVVCRAMNDVYLDTKNNMHILYTRQGKSTGGKFKRYHAVYKDDGTQIYHGELTFSNGGYCRIFQDKNERYFLLDDNGMLFMLQENSYAPIDSLLIDLQGYEVNYSGYGLSVPRTGTRSGDTMQIVYPSGEGKMYVYFCLKTDELFPFHSR